MCEILKVFGVQLWSRISSRLEKSGLFWSITLDGVVFTMRLLNWVHRDWPDTVCTLEDQLYQDTIWQEEKSSSKATF